MGKSKKPTVDNPISSSKEDLLDRTNVAYKFAKSIRNLDAADGLVIGVMGAWGSGKTSFINLMREEFENKPALKIVDFNPWMFSGSSQLVTVFFDELIAELSIEGDKFDKVTKALGKYGEKIGTFVSLIPKVGKPIGASFKWIGKLSKAATEKDHSATELKNKVSAALKELDQPIVVVIDDIDRLSTEEIRDIFKLVRLTASFPNLIYVLAFDRDRVEKALDDTSVPGRAYLEKIIQLGFDLPAVSKEVLRSQVFRELDNVLSGIGDIHIDEERWPDVYFEIIEPLIGSMRDVTRMAVSMRPTLESLGAEIDCVDILALESLRVFRPNIFAQLQNMKATLTSISDRYDRDDSRQKDEIEELVRIADDDRDYIKNLVSRVFPAASQFINNTHYGHDFATEWRRGHRVAHVDYLSLYFERTTPTGLMAFRRAEAAYEVMSDGSKFGQFLDELNPEYLEDTISALEAYEHTFTPDKIVGGAVELLNRIYCIPERDHRGIFDLGRPDMTVGRVVLRMLRRVEDEAERERMISEILSKLHSYSTRLDFIHLVGYKEGVGHKLVSEQMAEDLEKSLLSEILAKTIKLPNKEWDLLRVYLFVKQQQGDDYVPVSLIDPTEIRSLFKGARSVMQSQSFGTRTIRTEEHLAWEVLIGILGSEDAIRSALTILRKKDKKTPLVLLVDKYLGGWRPSRD